MKKILLLAFCLLLCTAYTFATEDETALAEHKADLIAKTTELMASGDFGGALTRIIVSARRYPSDMELRDEFSRLKTVISLRDKIVTETDDKKFQGYSSALRQYYYRKGLYQVALELDNISLARLPQGQGAENLIETLLLLDRDQQAGEQLKTLELSTPRLKTLALLAKARTVEKPQYGTDFDNLKIQIKDFPYCSFDQARLLAICDDNRCIDALVEFLTVYPCADHLAARNMILTASEFESKRQSKEFIAIIARIESMQADCVEEANCKQKK